MSKLFKKPKAPATPDYAGLAQQQGQANQDAAVTTAQLGSPNETTPWGSISRQYDPTSKQFTYTTSLSPDQDKLFQGSEDIDLAKMDLGKQQIGNLSDLWSQPLDTSGMTNRVTNVAPSNLQTSFRTSNYSTDPGSAPGYQKALDLSGLGGRPSLNMSSLPALPGVGDFSADKQKVEDALYQQQTSRLDPQWQQQETQLRDRLYSQGIREGNPAWTQAFDDFNRQKNDAYQGARTSAITGGGAEQSRMFGMATTAHQQAAQDALSAAGFQLDERSQGVAEALTQGNFSNAVTQLERSYGLDRQAAVNAATQLQNSMNAQVAQFGNTAQQQGFDQNMENAVLANQSRDKQMDEAAFLRELPFNEFQAMTNGSQITPPNFSGPTVSPGVGAAPTYQAGQDQYTAAYNNYAQQMAALNQLWSSIGNMGSTAMKTFGG